MFTMAAAIGLLGAGLGAAGGLSSAAEKERIARDKFNSAEDMLDYTKKATAAKRTALSGNLTLQALSNTASSKKNAIAEYQANSAQNASLGTSGLSSGTPFYKLATDIQERRGQILDSLKSGDIQMGMAKANAEAEAISLDMADAQAADALMTAGDEYAYADSPVAYALSIASGAASGASMANNLMSLGVQTGFVSEDFLGSSLFGGASQSQSMVPSNAPDFRDSLETTSLGGTELVRPTGIDPLASYSPQPSLGLDSIFGDTLMTPGDRSWLFGDSLSSPGLSTSYLDLNPNLSASEPGLFSLLGQVSTFGNTPTKKKTSLLSL